MVALIAFGNACAGDARTTNRADTRCSDCDIVLLRVGVMTDSTDPGSLPDIVYAERDSQGRVYTASRNRTSVLVFDSTGARIAELGSAGAGPREYRAIRRVLVGPDDSMFVSDWGTGRITVYDPSLRFVRTQLSQYPPSLVLPDGSFVIADQIRARRDIGYPIHTVDPSGRLLRSFGTDTPQYSSDMRLIANRLVAAASSGRVWAAPQGRYVIERWNPATGTLEQRSTIESAWFTDIATWNYDERVRPGSVIESLWEGDDGLMWVVFRVPDLNWRVPDRANEERVISDEEYKATYDWIIEAVDVGANAVLATRRFDGILWVRPPSRVIVSGRVDDQGVASFEVWVPELVQKDDTQ
jgi:hypothetical protein